LRHVRDPLGYRAGRKRGHVEVVDLDTTFVGQQARHRLEQRALARTVRSEKREHLAGFGFEAHVVKHGSASEGDAHASCAQTHMPVAVTHRPAPGEPSGISLRDGMTRAMMSHATRKTPPASAAAGISR